ncbi:MAG: hypothetical protein IJ234_07560 [Clostridia bacterium]|nr:hypothetical protein [Clostridia bacterium]
MKTKWKKALALIVAVWMLTGTAFGDNSELNQSKNNYDESTIVEAIHSASSGTATPKPSKSPKKKKSSGSSSNYVTPVPTATPVPTPTPTPEPPKTFQAGIERYGWTYVNGLRVGSNLVRNEALTPIEEEGVRYVPQEDGRYTLSGGEALKSVRFPLWPNTLIEPANLMAEETKFIMYKDLCYLVSGVQLAYNTEDDAPQSYHYLTTGEANASANTARFVCPETDYLVKQVRVAVNKGASVSGDTVYEPMVCLIDADFNQFTLEGAKALNLREEQDPVAVTDGLQCAFNPDGSYTLNGTAEKNGVFGLNPVEILPVSDLQEIVLTLEKDVTYAISGVQLGYIDTSDPNGNYRLLNANAENRLAENAMLFTPTSDLQVLQVRAWYPKGVYQNEKFEPMLVELGKLSIRYQ